MSTISRELPDVPTTPPAPLPDPASGDGDPDLIWLGRWIKLLSAGAFAASTVLSFVSPIRAAVGGQLLAAIAIGGMVGTGVGILIQKLGHHSSFLFVGAVVLIVLPLAYKARANRKKVKGIASTLGVESRELFKPNVSVSDEHERQSESGFHPLHPDAPCPSTVETERMSRPQTDGERTSGTTGAT